MLLCDEIAVTFVGTPASEYGYLLVLGRRKLVDSVVGLHLLVNDGKTVKSGFTYFAFANINPSRTKFLTLMNLSTFQKLKGIDVECLTTS